MTLSRFILTALLASRADAAPLSTAALNTANAAPWALSLSGNGFLAMAHGAGVFKALSNAGYLEELTTVSSVSGGSWLNTLLAFSPSFHDGLIGSRAGEIEDWFMQVQGESVTRGQEMQPTACMQVNEPINCWADFVGAFLYPSEVRSLSATAEHRVGVSQAELLIASNIATQSLMSDQSTTTLLDVPDIELPAYYAIPSAHKSWWPWAKEPQSTWNVPYTLGGSPTVQGDDGRTAAMKLPAPINVQQAGAVSSAANGAAGAPGIKAASQPTAHFCDVFPCANTNFSNVAETAICSDPSQGMQCAFPSVRLIDGCYSDNTGLALNIGHLQKKHPGEMLSIFVVNSNQCDRSKDAECMQSIHESTFRNLFSDSPYPDVASEGWIDAGAGINVPTVNRVIFEQVISDEQALGKAVGTEGVTVMTGTFTTLDNQAFGVSAGTSVRLVVFNANSAAPLQPASPDDMVKLSAVAKNSFAVATSVLQGEHSGVESTGALSLKAPTPDVEALEIGAAKPVGVSLAPFWLGTLVGVVLAATAFVGALFTMRVMMTKKDAATACQRNMIVVEHETSSPDYEPL